MLFSLLRSFCRRRDGSVSVISAITLPVIVGFLALGADYGHGLVIKTENQRAADLSAFAGALAYSSTGTTAAMTAAAQRLAALNGITATQVTATLVTSPRNAANQAVSVNIATNDVLLLAPVLRSGTSMPVNAKSYASLNATASACMLALSASGSGIALTGGTSISAPACTVASNTTVSVPCGDTITAKSVTYNTTVPSQPCSGISGSITKTPTADPLASNAGIVQAAAHASSLSSLTSPSAPSVPSGKSITFDWSTSATSAATSAGCSASFSSPTWTLTCPPGGTYYFGTISVGGGITLNFNPSGSASTTYDFSGPLNNTGTAMNFGPGTYNFAQGIVNTSTMNFGAGTFNIGGASGSCGFYSICNSGGATLTFGGPSSFTLSSGLYNGGGATITFGSGTTNSFKIGSTGSGSNAINVQGGSKTTFADATGTGNLFQVVGNITSGGGSCLTLSAATAHDFNGSFSAAGGTILGTGVYSFYGYIALGAGGGGDVSCNGQMVGFTGTNVTVVTAGASTSSTSPCSGSAFCIGAGYNHVSLTAPTTGTNANLGVIGPVSTSNTATALLTEGASNTSISGAFYFPNGPLTLSGGASIGNQTGQCLQIVASQITLSGGTSASASNCFSASGSSSTVQLVQ
jgi:hypothetical protein